VGNFIFFFRKVEKKNSFLKKRRKSGKRKSLGGKEWEKVPLNFSPIYFLLFD